MEYRISTSDKIYANSLIEVSDDYSAILENLSTLLKIVNSSYELKDLMNNPTITNEKKFDIIEQVLKNSVDERIINFVKVLISKNKFSDLNSICEAYAKTVEDLSNSKSVTVISAIDLPDELKVKILNKLNEKYSKTIKAEWVTDSEIIGGLIIKSDDEVTDCSIRNKLYKISKI